MRIISLLLVLVSVCLSQPYPGDLIAWYKLNGNVNDSFTDHINGTMDQVKPVKDRFGKDSSAMYFDGANSYMSVTSNWYYLLYGTLTFCMWQYVTATDFVNITMGKPAGKLHYHICKRADSLWVTCNNTNNITTHLDTGWQHIAVVFDNSTDLVSLYVNGEFRTSKTLQFPIYDIIDPLLIGKHDDNSFPTRYFKGTLDELLIYSKALTASQIKYIFNPLTSTLPRSLTVTSKLPTKNTFNLLGKKLGNMYAVQPVYKGGLRIYGIQCKRF